MNEINKTDQIDHIDEIVDSHAHLDMDDFTPDRDQVVEKAFKAGVKAILCPADVTSSRSLEITFELIEKHKGLSGAAGIHPHKAKYFKPDFVQKIRDLASAKKIVAVGEIGLDFHYNFSTPQDQRETFRSQLNLAQELALPVIIHSRKAGLDLVKAIKEEHFTQGGILHCFTEDLKTAKSMINYNFFISFSGILSFPKAQPLREVAQKIPLGRLLVETDSPYLAPIPYRGKRNEPSYVVEVAKILAALKKISWPELAWITTRNFISIFRLTRKHLYFRDIRKL